MILGLREILAPALASAGLDAAAITWRIGELWADALGERIGSRAVPLRLTRGELLVAVPDAVWRQELSLLAPEIVARLNDKLGEPIVQRLRFVAAAATPDPTPTPRRRLRAESTTEHGAPPSVDAGTEVGSALADLWRSRARRLERDEPRRQDKGSLR